MLGIFSLLFPPSFIHIQRHFVPERGILRQKLRAGTLLQPDPAASASLCLILLHFSCWVRIFPAHNHSSRWWDKGMLTRKLPGSQKQQHLFVTECQNSVFSTAGLVQGRHGFIEKSGKSSPALFGYQDKGFFFGKRLNG